MPILAWLKTRAASAVFGCMFLSLPDLEYDEERAQAFEQLFQSACQAGAGNVVDYDCAYPKADFLRYLVSYRNVLLHGSNRADISTLHPRRQSDFAGKPVTAVFASGDGVWPIFFATLDHELYRGSLRNGCFVIADGMGLERRFYFFSINQEMLPCNPWIDGMVYILPREPFGQTSRGAVRFDEWASEEPVEPLAKLPVSPADFPFLLNVAGHDERESIYVSWLRFKRRQPRP